MSIRKVFSFAFLLTTCAVSFCVHAANIDLPPAMLKIINQPKYQHANWGLYVRDVDNDQILYDLNSDQMFLPASTTKLFSTSALLHAYGIDYRFKTPVYAIGKILNDKLEGNLVLVGQGDLTLGGRQKGPDIIEFTNLDHTIANNVPGVTLTKENPLNGLKGLAKQIRDKGIKEINGDVLIDDRLFETIEKRGTSLSPTMINENLIDIVLYPTEDGNSSSLTWRPEVPGYTVKNEVKTVAKDKPLQITVSADESGKNILVSGTIPMGQKDVVRTSAIKDSNQFARAAFIKALRDAGITVNLKTAQLPSETDYKDLDPVALWTSPPLTEYVKLILKVSHNTGANLVPLLLAVRNGEKSFNEGMKLFGDFTINNVKLSPEAFVFIDGAGGDENRLTPQGEVQLLEYMRKQSPDMFHKFMDALPILGVDGSMADFAKNTDAVGKVFAKPGTGISQNTATGKFFLTTQALAGYIKAKNGHLIEFMVAVNNGTLPTIEDIFPIFEDESQITAIIYDMDQQ